MANKSIYNAFERMWQHITAFISNKTSKQTMVDMIYPVGSIYISLSETNPFENCGVWEKIESETFLMSAGIEETSLGQTGGNNTIDILKNNLPSGINSITAHTGNFAGINAIETTSNPTSKTFYLVENAGISEAINSTPKYLAVNIWKRIE